MTNVGEFLIQNVNFLGPLSTFRTENKPENRPLRAQNNAQTFLKQLRTNFEKVEKTTFLPLNWSKQGCKIGKKWSCFGSICQNMS